MRLRAPSFYTAGMESNWSEDIFKDADLLVKCSRYSAPTVWPRWRRRPFSFLFVMYKTKSGAQRLISWQGGRLEVCRTPDWPKFGLISWLTVDELAMRIDQWEPCDVFLFSQHFDLLKSRYLTGYWAALKFGVNFPSVNYGERCYRACRRRTNAIVLLKS